MEVRSYDGENLHKISFAKGEPTSDLETIPLGKNERRTGTVIRWKPDLEVFTDIAIPHEFFSDVLRRQSVTNAGLEFDLRLEQPDGTFTEQSFVYPNGIADYIAELASETSLTAPVLWKMEAEGRDRADKEPYKFRAEIAFCVSNTVNVLEYYHCSSYLEHGGSPDKAVHSAFVYALDKYMKANGKYNKNESKITFGDIEDCLVLVINSISTQTSYENQTKKAINNRFIAEALTDYLKLNLEHYLTENPTAAEIFANQVLVNKRSRESAESARLNLKKKADRVDGYHQPGRKVRQLPFKGPRTAGALHRGG